MTVLINMCTCSTSAGFDLDGVEEYTDLRQALGQDQGSIEVFNTPVVEQFTDVLVFNPKTEDNIEIKVCQLLVGTSVK